MPESDPDDPHLRYITHNGKKWLVHAEDGKVLGEHDNKEDAQKQLDAIEISKNKAKKSEMSEKMPENDPEKRFLTVETRFLVPEKRILTPMDAELRVAKSSEGPRRIVGYAARFGKLSQNLGGFVEKIHPKAFENALKTSDVRALRNHDPDKMLGRTKSGTLRLSVDDMGLRYEIDAPDTAVGRDTVTDIERGDIDGSSFSFNTEEEEGDEWDDSTSPPTRTLMRVRDLFDVGPVSFPAYTDTDAFVRDCRSYHRLIASRQKSVDQKKAEQEARLQALDARLQERLKRRKS